MGSGVPEHGGGRVEGEKGEESEGIRFPCSPRAGAACGGRPTAVGGGGKRRLWWWCCGAGAKGWRWRASSWWWRAASQGRRLLLFPSPASCREEEERGRFAQKPLPFFPFFKEPLHLSNPFPKKPLFYSVSRISPSTI